MSAASPAAATIGEHHADVAGGGLRLLLLGALAAAATYLVGRLVGAGVGLS